MQKYFAGLSFLTQWAHKLNKKKIWDMVQQNSQILSDLTWNDPELILIDEGIHRPASYSKKPYDHVSCLRRL